MDCYVHLGGGIHLKKKNLDLFLKRYLASKEPPGLDDIVCCPKYRHKIIKGCIEDTVKQTIQEIYTNYGYTLIQMETMPDHLHIIPLCSAYFLNERDDDLGDLAASLILDFFMEKLAPEFYNQGVYDSYKYMSEYAG